MLTFAAGSFKNEPINSAGAPGNGPCAVDEPQDASAATPLYQRGPRIIQVPQTGARYQAGLNDRDEPDATNKDDDEEAAPPPRRRLATPPQVSDNPPLRPRAPRWQPRSDISPPAADTRRTVLNAPPPPAQGPTPIRPLPRAGAKSDPADKFPEPRDTNAPPVSDPQ
jgi:hypothetical protein